MSVLKINVYLKGVKMTCYEKNTILLACKYTEFIGKKKEQKAEFSKQLSILLNLLNSIPFINLDTIYR